MDDPLCCASSASVSRQAAAEERQRQRVSIQLGVFLRLPCICVHQIAALHLAFTVMTGAVVAEEGWTLFPLVENKERKEKKDVCKVPTRSRNVWESRGIWDFQYFPGPEKAAVWNKYINSNKKIPH